MHFSTLFSAATLAAPALAGYVLEDDYMKDFYGAFDFFTDPDPTHGFVKYIDQATARSMKLINASTTVPVEWGVDTVGKDPAGRASLRLTSKKKYNKGLVVIDVQHMPFGCGTWPAFWMVGPDWPNAGEIDIIEGVHEQEANSIALHTSAGCSVGADHGAFAGTVATTNCDVKALGQAENVGCSIKQSDPKSYGKGLNSNGGGVYATEWTSDAINVYFFPRGAVPKDALGDAPDPKSWGKPAAEFANTGCNIDKFFKNQQIVFDTTFCGDWAGNTWSTSSCKAKAPTCNEYVRDNPAAFTDAYWTVNALKVYQNNGEAPKPSTPAAPPKSSGIAVPSALPLPSSDLALPSALPSTPPKPSSPAAPPKSSNLVPVPSAGPSPPPEANSSLQRPPKPSLSTFPNFSRGTRPGRPTAAPVPENAGPVISNALEPVGASIMSSASPSSSSAPKALENGNHKGFKWPAASGSGAVSARPSNSAASGAPFPTGGGRHNGTRPAYPTGTGTGWPINWSTVGRFSLSRSSGAAPSQHVRPSDLEIIPSFGPDVTSAPAKSTPTSKPVPADGQDLDVLVETVVRTIIVTVEGGAEATPAPGARMGRRAREERRRRVVQY